MEWSFVNLVPVMEVEVRRQRRRGSLRGERVRKERVRKRESCLIMLLREERRYTRITLGFRSQGVEQFIHEGKGMFVREGNIRGMFVRGTMFRGEWN